MDDSQAAKRAIEPSSLPLPAVSRARTVSPTTRVPEPLSYFPEHASPSSRLVAAPLVGSVEIFRPVLLPRSEDPPERRLNISMTITEYEGLVSSLQDRFQQARTLGQEQGVQAMNEVVNQLVNLVERMYREGRELQQQYDRLEATLVDERRLVVQWLERTKLELQKEAQEFVESHRQSLQRQFEEERSKLTISFEHEREEARAEYLRQVTLQAQVAARHLDDTKRTLSEEFRQQQSDAQAQMKIQSQRFIDEYKREIDLKAVSQSNAGKADVDAAIRIHQGTCEQEFQRKAHEFKNQVESDHLRETSQLHSTINALKLDNADLQNRAVSSGSSFDRVMMEQTVLELREEKEKFRGAYNRTTQELTRMRKDCERQAEQCGAVAPALSPSDRQKTQDEGRWGLHLFAGKTSLYDSQPAPVMSQALPAPSLPFKTRESLPAGWGSSPTFGASTVQHPYGTGNVNGYGASAPVQPSWQQQQGPPP